MGNIISAARPNETNQTVTDKNPGTFDELHSKCKDIFPNCCKGAEVVFGKVLSSHLQVYHTINLSSESKPEASGYKFRAVYTGTKEVGRTEDSRLKLLYRSLKKPVSISPLEYQTHPVFSDKDEQEFDEIIQKQRFPVFEGIVDASGNLEAFIIHALTQNSRSKLHTMIQDNNCKFIEEIIDYRGSDYTASLTVGLLDKQGFLVTQYLQKVTSRLLLGAEFGYWYGPKFHGGELTTLAVATKITGDKWTLSGNVRPSVSVANFCYHHTITENLEVGSEIETNLAAGTSLCKLAYHLKVPEGSLQFRGSVDTNWEIEATLETPLSPFPYTLTLSGMASLTDFQKPKYRFGIGLVIFDMLEEKQVLDEQI